jgi:hypothetical protein
MHIFQISITNITLAPQEGLHLLQPHKSCVRHVVIRPNTCIKLKESDVLQIM